MGSARTQAGAKRRVAMKRALRGKGLKVNPNATNKWLEDKYRKHMKKTPPSYSKYKKKLIKSKKKPLTVRQKTYKAHSIKIGDFRPIASKNTKYCTICGTHGKKLYTEKCFKNKKQVIKIAKKKQLRKMGIPVASFPKIRTKIYRTKRASQMKKSGNYRKIGKSEYRILRKLGFGMGVQMTNKSIAKDLKLSPENTTKITKRLHKKKLLKRNKKANKFWYSISKKGFDYLKKKNPTLMKNIRYN